MNPLPNKIIQGDSLKVLKTFSDESIDCVVTSPPYWALRDYGSEGQLGLENTPDEYISNLCDIFDEVRRVLKPSGTCWVNIGDTYGGQASGFQGKTGAFLDRKVSATRLRSKDKPNPKSLMLIPARFSIEMVRRGWTLRNEIIWHKPNVMPSSAKDRFTVDFEPVFFFVKSSRYFFEQQFDPLSPVSIERVKYGWKSEKANASAKAKTVGIAVNEMGSRFANPRGRNRRTVWKISTSSSRLKHVAMFPEKLIDPMIKAGCPKGGIVLDPFMGSGTVGVVVKKNSMNYVGIELNANYIKEAEQRINCTQLQII